MIPGYIQSNIDKGTKNSVRQGLDSLVDWVYAVDDPEVQAERATEAMEVVQPMLSSSGVDGMGQVEGGLVYLDGYLAEFRRPLERLTANRTAGTSSESTSTTLARGNQAAANEDRSEAPVASALTDSTPTADTGDSGGGTSTGGSGGGSQAHSHAPTTGPAGTGAINSMLPDGVLPGGYEIWQVDNEHWAVYQVPETDVHIGFLFRDESELAAIGAYTPRRMTGEEAQKRGLVDGGFATQLNNRSQHPFDALVEDYEQAASMRPWLEDPGVLAVVSEAILEGREVTQEELLATQWFRDRTPEEIQWAKDVGRYGDRWAAERIEEARTGVEESLAKAGITNPPEEAVDLLATKWRTGEWSDAKFKHQLSLLADPYKQGQMDFELVRAITGQGDASGGDRRAKAAGRDAVRRRIEQMFKNRSLQISTAEESASERLERLVDEVYDGRDLGDIRRSLDIAAGRVARPELFTQAGVDENLGQVDRVKDLMRRWLGPFFSDGYDEQWIAEWAGKLRNDPDAETELVELLKERKQAVLPEYGKDQPYEAIAGPWKSLFTRVWGQQADESDPIFHKILRMNDAAEATKLLRKEGLKRGVGTVVNSAIGGLIQATGGSVITGRDF